MEETPPVEHKLRGRKKGFKRSPEELAKQKATRAANKAKQTQQPIPETFR